MADYTGIFERVEQKYLLDSLQFEALWAVLTPRIICWRDFRAKSPSIKKSCVCVPTACRKRKARRLWS